MRRLALSLFLALGAAAAETPTDADGVLAAARAAYEAGDYARAVDVVAAYRGEETAALHLLRGHAESRRENWAAAADAYTRALALEPENAAAGTARAQAFARLEKWDAALADAGRFIDPARAGAAEILLYAQLARRCGDEVLCRRLAARARERFPADGRLRRLELELLLADGAWADAARAARALLRQTPEDAGLWNSAAYAAQNRGELAEAAAAAEAAWLLVPRDAGRLRAYLAAETAAGNWETVLAEGDRRLTADAARAGDFPPETPELRAFFLRAAEARDDTARWEKWLARVPETARTRAETLSAARLALRLGKTDAARAALETLVKAGAADGAVCLWAGRLAEDAGDAAAAETFYRQAAGGARADAAARLGGLHLARFLGTHGRPAEAKALLARHLADYPEDAAARALAESF